MQKPVLFRVTNNLKIGGVQRRLRGVLPLLAKNFEVHVVTYKRKGVFWDELQDLGVRTHFVRIRGKWDPAGIWRLSRLMRRHGAQIVHTHSLGANISGVLAAALAGVPIRVAQSHHRGNHWYARTAFGRRKQIFQEAMAHKLFTDRLLAPSQEILNHFGDMTGFPEDKRVLLHNGLDLDDLAPKRLRDTVRAEIGASPETILIGFVGRLTKGKGLHFFLKYAASVLAQNPRYMFAVVGGGKEHLDWAEEWVKSRQLGQGIKLLGERYDVGEYFNTFDCLLFTSQAQWESIPGVVLEACNASLPVLAKESEALHELLPYYPRLRFVRPGEDPEHASPADLIQALEEAMALPPADVERFRSHFSMEAMAARTAALYEELLREKGIAV